MTKTNLLNLLFLTTLITCCFTYCKTNDPSSPENTYRNLQPDVSYTGMATCRSCHNNVHETFIQTGMGRSFDRATRQKSDATFGPDALVYDSLNNFYYFPYFNTSDEMYVMEFRLENGDTVHKRTEKISYIVGSGQHTNSHIIDINGYVFQAPVTWYTQDKRWDLAPGFRNNNSRFDRWLTDECITCHNHYPTQVPGSLHKFTNMPTGIECERCHGPGEIHVREKLAGNNVDTSKYIDYSIVTPSDLPRERQMDLCQRCHLQGIAVTEPGKTFFDFKPGMRLHEVMNIYLPRYTDSHEQFIMASQADRLRQSRCFMQAAELTCLSCHNPHQSVQATPREQYNNACKKCHSEKTCTESSAARSENQDDCAACHMPKSGSIDIPHVRITDHLIRRPQTTGETPHPEPKAFLGLQILTRENPTPLDMARGYLAMYDKYLASPVMLDSAAWYLARSKAGPAELFPLRIHYLFLRDDNRTITQEAAQLSGNSALDAWTAYRIGEAFLKLENPLPALEYFTIASDKLPFHLDFLEKKGIALLTLKRLKEARQVFEAVLRENPKRPIAQCNLGYYFALTGNNPEALRHYDQAIALDPDYEQALLNKAALLLKIQQNQAAQKVLDHLLKVNPDNESAKILRLQM